MLVAYRLFCMPVLFKIACGWPMGAWSSVLLWCWADTQDPTQSLGPAGQRWDTAHPQIRGDGTVRRARQTTGHPPQSAGTATSIWTGDTMVVLFASHATLVTCYVLMYGFVYHMYTRVMYIVYTGIVLSSVFTTYMPNSL